MLIRFALWLGLLSLPLFLLAKVLLIFAFIVFATFATKFAIFLLFSAFGILLFIGFVGILRWFWLVIFHYFSAEQRGKRQLLFMQNRQADRNRLFYFQRLQLTYFKERQRNKILEKNNQEQINVLSEAIERELRRIKSQLSKDHFSQLQAENRRYRMKQNEQALLELHARISKLNQK